ncbi:MAG TPA: GNAT family N-acetyltransferase [Flavobacteriia bacterium]|nr:GNAT family N-acetyltransferase [Flavobacteriia bacterium]
MVIRKGQKEDMPHILSLIKELATFEKEPNAVIIDTAYLVENAFSTPPLFYTFVAELEGEIVGMALFYYRFSTWKGKTIHLEDLIVKQDKRGLGIGKALYNKVLKFAQNEKVKRVEWVVLDWNKNAIDFYKKTGATILTDWRTVQMTEEKLNSYLKTQQITD